MRLKSTITAWCAAALFSMTFVAQAANPPAMREDGAPDFAKIEQQLLAYGDYSAKTLNTALPAMMGHLQRGLATPEQKVIIGRVLLRVGGPAGATMATTIVGEHLRSSPMPRGGYLLLMEIAAVSQCMPCLEHLAGEAEGKAESVDAWTRHVLRGYAAFFAYGAAQAGGDLNSARKLSRQAIDEFQQALAKDSADDLRAAQIHLLLFDLYRIQEDHGQAVRHAMLSMQRMPNGDAFVKFSGYLMDERGEVDRAVAIAIEAQSRMSTPDITRLVGIGFYKQWATDYLKNPQHPGNTEKLQAAKGGYADVEDVFITSMSNDLMLPIAQALMKAGLVNLKGTSPVTPSATLRYRRSSRHRAAP